MPGKVLTSENRHKPPGRVQQSTVQRDDETPYSSTYILHRCSTHHCLSPTLFIYFPPPAACSFDFCPLYHRLASCYELPIAFSTAFSLLNHSHSHSHSHSHAARIRFLLLALHTHLLTYLLSHHTTPNPHIMTDTEAEKYEVLS